MKDTKLTIKKHLTSLILFCLAVISLLTFCVQPQTTHSIDLGTANVIASHCNLYTDATFSSDKVVSLDDLGQPTTITLRLDEEVSVLETKNDFTRVKARGFEGWVYKYYITQNQSQDVYPVFNGKVSKDTIIYAIDNYPKLDESLNYMIAKKGTRIYLYQGFNDKKEMTAVQLVLENGKLYTGYLATKDIQPDGVSKLLIVAITVIVAAVTIVLSIVFIKKKKNKTKKQ